MRKEALFVACLACCALADAAAPVADTETLDEVAVTAARERERQRGPLRTADAAYRIGIRYAGDGIARIQLTLWGIRQPDVSFRRPSAARRLAPQTARSRLPGDAARLAGDRLMVTNGDSLGTVFLDLGANVVEPDGLPASLQFGPHALLVNLDYARLRDATQGESSIGVRYGIHPQTRRCLGQFVLLDDRQDSRNRFVLLGDSFDACQRVANSREGDLLFAADLPAKLRQAVQEVHDPTAARIATRLGNESGLIFVGWWPQSPHQGFRFEQSWNRNSLLLFHGADWRDGLDPHQRESLSAVLRAEQIHRRVRQADWPGAFTEAGASYLLTLVNAGQASDTPRTLAAALPGWIRNCDTSLEWHQKAASRSEVSSVECGLVVQFVYDAVARWKTAGRENLQDVWRRLLNAASRRGQSGVDPAAFLASSPEASLIVQGVLAGNADWVRLAADIQAFGVQLRVDQDAPGIVSVLSLAHFHDEPR